MSFLDTILSGLTNCSCNECVPDINYTVISNETLNPLPNDGLFYELDFGTVCPGNLVNKKLTICNFTTDPFNFCYSTQDTPDFIFPDLSGETILPSNCKQITVWFSGTTDGYKETQWVSVANSGCCITIRATGTIGETLIVDSGCTLDFGMVTAGSSVNGSFNITSNELGGTHIYISGDTSDFSFDRYHHINNTTSIPVTFNPTVPYGDKSTTLIVSGGCSNHIFNLCGRSIYLGSVYSTEASANAFVGCCTDLTITVYNNILSTDQITIDSIIFNNTSLTLETPTTYTIPRADCLDLTFTYCPTTQSNTITTVTINYSYIVGLSTLTGSITSDLDLTGYNHPFNSLNPDTCFDYLCYSGNSGYTLNIQNSSPIDLNIQYFVRPVTGYNVIDFIDTTPNNNLTISGNTTGSINFNLYPWLITSARTFNEEFQLVLVDTQCCRIFDQCIYINFCEITTTNNYGYPRNISCYGGNDGAISFTINGCNNQTYDIIWSSSTQELPYTSTTVTGLPADQYTIKITDECGENYYKYVTLTQPTPLFARIQTYNPNNYCKNNLPELCGIINENTVVPPSGYVTISKETIVRVVNNDIHNIPGQKKTGFQGADPRTNQIANGNQVDANNAFKNYILDYATGAFERYKQKKILEEIITVKKWDEIIAETLGDGCCYVSYVTGGTAPYTYQWTGPNGFTSNSPNLFDIPCCDVYTLTVTDNNGCTYTTTGKCETCSFGVSELDIIRPTCWNSTDGEINVIVSGNCSTYDSLFNNPSGQYIISLESTSWFETYTGTSASFTDLGRGTYVLNIEDVETGCKTQPRRIGLTPYVEFIMSVSTTGTTCQNSCNGSLTITAELISTTPVCTGYTENNYFLYKLNDGNYVTGSTFTNLCSGNYTVTVKDLCTGCEKTQTIKVPNLNLFNVQTDVIDASSESSSDGQITLTINNGQPFQSCRILTENNDLGFVLENDCWLLFEKDSSNEYYFINCIKEKNTNNTYTISNLKPGTYYYEIEDNNHCVFTSKVIVGYKTRKQNKGFGVDTKSTGLYGGFSIEKI